MKLRKTTKIGRRGTESAAEQFIENQSKYRA